MITANKQLLWKPILSIDCSEPGFPKFSADGNNEKLLPSSIIPTNSLTQYLKQFFSFQKLATGTFLYNSHFISRCQCFTGGYFIKKEIFFICSFGYYFNMKVHVMLRNNIFLNSRNSKF